jgi:sporulation protein YabP
MNTQQSAQPALPQNVILEDRKRLSVSGVSDVDSFDERTVSVFTTLGELSVRGSQLHITSLNVETGELAIEGQVDALLYALDRPQNGGFFSRVFR